MIGEDITAARHNLVRIYPSYLKRFVATFLVDCTFRIENQAVVPETVPM